MPIVLQLFVVQAAHAASPVTGTLSQGAVLAGLTQTTPTPTPTPSAAPDQSRPVATPSATAPTTSGQPAPSTSQSARTTTNTNGPRREVFGYATAGSLADPSIGYPSWNFDLLSTVAFFSIHVTYNGVLVADSDWTVWDSSTLTGMVSTAHAHGVKVVVSIKTLYGPGDTIDFCDTLYNAQTTVDQIVNQVKLKGIDGVNIDYEGQLFSCTNNDPTLNTTSQVLMTQFAAKMRAGLDNYKKGLYLSIATYSGSALGNDGFFNISAINPYVDSFFVMAYDMDAANLPYPPLNCAGFCMNPVSPLANYYWNDTASMTSYSTVVGAGKTILGQPYYGRVACVASPVEHATSTGSLAAATYTGAAAVASSPDVQSGTFATHRDSSDPAGMDRWDTWYDNSLGCWREMDWSDTTTLGVRYNLVNQMNLRGVGLWTLNYGGGAAELWTALQTYFENCYALDATVQPGSPQYTGASVTVTASAGCPDPKPLYEFWVAPPGATSYQLAQAYSTNPTYTWNTTNALAAGGYRFSIWVRDSNSTGAFGNQFGRWDTYNNNIVYTLKSSLCSGLGAAISPGSQAAVATPVTVTAQTPNCPNPMYQFWIAPPGATSYQLAQAYSSSDTYSWSTTNLIPGTYRFSIWARDASSNGVYGNQIGRWDTYNNSLTYTLTSCSSVSVSLAPATSTEVGNTVTVTAQAVGCTNPLYQFWIASPGATAYQLAGAYSTSNSYTWSTTNLAPGNYTFSIWVRDANSSGAYGNQSGRWDTYTTSPHRLSSCSSLSISASPVSSTTVGKTVTFTATAADCTNALYEFWIGSPGPAGYQLAQAYSSSTTYTWSTSGLARGTYYISVWVRDSNSSGAYGNQNGRWDVYTASQYGLS